MWRTNTRRRKSKLKNQKSKFYTLNMWGKARKRKTRTLEWEDAHEIKVHIKEIVEVLNFSHVNPERIFCFRSHGSKSRAYARIWSFPKIFQRALNIEAAYVIEILSKYFDKLGEDDKKKVLIHELLHIPKNFSGALLSHKIGKRTIAKMTNEYFKDYKTRKRH